MATTKRSKGGAAPKPKKVSQRPKVHQQPVLDPTRRPDGKGAQPPSMPPSAPVVLAPFVLIQDTKPYRDPQPTECETCTAVRECTAGHQRTCRWCLTKGEGVPTSSRRRRGRPPTEC